MGLRAATAAALLLAFAAGGAKAQAAALPLAVDVEWASRPSETDFAAAYPKRAQRKKPAGHIVLTCRIDEAGLLQGCKALTEAPGGFGLGEAALKLAPRFRAKPLAADGTPVAGRVVDIPIVFMVQGKPTPPTAHQPGRPSVLVTAGTEGPGDPLACPSKDDAKRMCQSHGFAWEAGPTVRTAGATLRKAGRREGVSFMECARADDGRLTACTITGDTPARSKSVMLELAEQFRAPVAAADGTPLSAGRILTTWEWAAMMRAVDIAEDLPATEPARP